VSLFARGVGAKPSDLVVHSGELDARAIRRSGERVQVAFDTVPEDLVGLDVELRPAGAELGWAITLDGRPWPVERIYGGALGMRLAHADQGLAASLEPSLIESATLPHVAASHELGLFVTREPSSGPQEAEISAEAQVEAEQAMQAWGYARKPSKKTP
jgi:hypothetical protein